MIDTQIIMLSNADTLVLRHSMKYGLSVGLAHKNGFRTPPSV